MAKTIGELAIKITAITTDFDKKINAMGKAGIRGQKSIAGLSRAIGTGLKVAIAGATVAMTAFVASTAKVGASFEKEMSILGSIKGISKSSKEGAKQLELLEEKARVLGSSTAYSATEATVGMQQLARAGLETNQVIGAIGPALQFAGASATSMQSATTLLASTMKQFNLTSLDASRITDAFTVIQQKSLFDMESLSNAMRYAGVTGASFGKSLEETTASVAMFRDLGMEGAQAGTTYRMAMQKLAKVTPEATKVFEKYNIRLEEINPSLQSFDKIARRLAKANMTFPEISTIFGTRASGAMNSVIEQFGTLEEGKTTFDMFMKAMEDSAGVTERTYQATLANLSGFTDIAKSALQELQLTLFDTFAGPLMELIGGKDGSGGITGMINTMALAIGVASDTISNDVGSALGGVLQGIKSNSDQIAIKFANMIISIAEILAILVQWVPVLAKIALFMTTIFVSIKLVAFVGTLSSALAVVTSALTVFIPALSSATAGLTLLGSAFIASNPIGWAVGIGVAVVALGALALGFSGADQRARQMESSLNAVRDAQNAYNQEARDGTAEIAKNSKVLFSAMKLELDKRGDLSSIIENQINQVSRFSEAQLAEAKAKGEVFKTTIAGQEAYILHATAEALARGEGEKYAHVIRDQQQEMNSLTAKTEAGTRNLGKMGTALTSLSKLHDDLNKGKETQRFVDLIAGSELGRVEDVIPKNIMNTVRDQYDLMDATIAVTSAIAGQKETLKLNNQSLLDYTLAMKVAKQEATELEARERLSEERRKGKEKKSGGSGRNLAKERANEIKALEKFELSLYDNLEKIGETYRDGVQRERNKEIANVEERYKKIISITKKGSADRIKAEKSMYKAISLVAQTSFAEVEEEYKKRSSELEKERTSREKNEVDGVLASSQEQLKIEQSGYEMRLDALIDLQEAKENAFIAEEASLLKIFKKGTDERRMEMQFLEEDRIAFAEETGDKLRQIEKDNENNNLSLLGQRSKKLEDIEKQSLRTISEIKKGFQDQDRISALQGEQELQRGLFQAQIKGLENADQLLMQFDSAQMTARLTAQQDLLDQFVNIHGDYSSQVMALDLAILSTRNSKKKEELAKEKAYYVSLAKLEDDLANVKKETATLSSEQRLKAEEVVLQQIEALNKNAQKFSIASIIDSIKKSIDDLKKSGGKLLAVGAFLLKLGKGGEEASEGLEKLKENVNDLFDAMMKGDLKSLFKGLIGPVVAFGTVAIKIFKSVGQGIMDLANAFKSGLDFMTGGANLNPMSLISEGASEITSAQNEAKEARAGLDKQLASGEISQGEFDSAIKAGVGEVDASQIGADFVQGVVDNAVQMIQAIASGAPAILQRLAQEIPILIDSLVKAIPQLVETLATQLPVVVFALIDGIVELLPVLVNTIVEFLPVLVDGIVVLLTEKLPLLLDTLTPLVVDLVGLIVQEVPKIVGAIVDALPDVVTFVVNAVKAILTGIPTIITTILDAVPQILTTLLGGVGDIIMAVFDAIPMIIKSVIMELPKILSSLVQGLIGVLLKIAGELPILLAEIIKMIPLLLESLVMMIGDLTIAVIEAIPDILLALITALPELIGALITLIPSLTVALLKQLPQIAVALVVSIFELIVIKIPLIAIELVKALVKGIGEGVQNFVQLIKDTVQSILEIPSKVGDALEGAGKKIGDGVKEVLTLGFAETDSYGDTPYAIKAGSDGMTANFAPNDYVIASQTKSGLLKQSLQALGQTIGGFGDLGGGPPSNGAGMVPPSGGGVGTINLSVNADGRLLDEITVSALEQGNAPRLEKRLTKGQGARVGFDRGRFNNY